MNRGELQEILAIEKKLYLGEQISRIRQMRKSRNRRYLIWCYLVAFRKCQYWRSVRQGPNIHGVQGQLAKAYYRYYDKKRNFLSERCGVEIGIDSQIGKGIDIWHGGIIINGILGENCTLHGNNIIGNKGKGQENEIPMIGNGVDIGAGANIIGEVKIADGIKIGANALVIKSFALENAVLIGVPAKIAVNKKEILNG